MKTKLYIKSLEGVLAKFKKGTLKVTYPDGSVRTYKNDDSVTASLKINSYDFFKKCFLYGDIGFGEAYMDGDWESQNLTELLCFIISNIENLEGASGGEKASLKFNVLSKLNKLKNLLLKNTKAQAQKNIHYHYDLSNDFFKLMLDDTMTYSCGIFEGEKDDLKQSQINKYKSLCDKLHIKESDHVLEIGSGWGGNAIFMAQTYGCKVTSVTISKEQLEYAKSKVQQAGLDHLIEIRYQDFRDIEGKFDKIVSIEMLEAIGEAYIDVYFQKVDRLLEPHGLFGLQVITSPDARYDEFKSGVDWIQKHIFPGSLLPSISRMNEATSKFTNLQIVSLKDIGIHYSKTLKIWRENFYDRLEEVKGLGFDQTFINKWEYYLSYCEAAFEMKNISDIQAVYSKPNNTLYKEV